MTPSPTSLSLQTDGSLEIVWDDGVTTRTPPAKLREACPCANCKEKIGHPAPLFPILKPGETEPIRIRSMKPVGNYAYGIGFSDGHDSGIYTLEYLRTVCTAGAA